MDIQPAQFRLTIPAMPAAPRPARGHKALWLIAVGLLANAAVMLFNHSSGGITLDRLAFAQAIPGAGGAGSGAGPLLGARGIYMMPAQLGPSAFGLYLLDVDSGTICVYKANPDTSHFRLMAARSYKYDRFLEDFNNDPLRPKDVQKLVEDQRQRAELHEKDDQATVDQTPKPDENAPDALKPAPK